MIVRCIVWMLFNEKYWLQVVISAEVPLKYLFSDEKPSDIYLQDENRALMDDLALSSDSVSFLLPNNKWQYCIHQ